MQIVHTNDPPYIVDGSAIRELFQHLKDNRDISIILPWNWDVLVDADGKFRLIISEKGFGEG